MPKLNSSGEHNEIRRPTQLGIYESESRKNSFEQHLPRTPGRQDSHGLSLPRCVEELIRDNNRKRDQSTEKSVFNGSISDLLSTQKLQDVFASFKDHQLEFETYLRPIMQEVLVECGESSAPAERATEAW